MNSITLRLKKVLPTAQIPKAMRQGDVAFDIFCAEAVTLTPHSVTKVRTGLVFADLEAEETRDDEFATPETRDWGNPEWHHGSNTPAPSAVFPKVEGRGGLAAKGIFPVGGIADSNYRGELLVLLCNVNDEPYHLNTGDRCAQLVFYRILAQTKHNEVRFEEVDTITSTDRGASGFGSSGQ